MKKKILSFMLAFAFILSVLPAGSTAVEEKSTVNGKDKKEAMEVVKSFISKAFSLQVENLEGLDLISKNAKDFEEYVKLRYQLNHGNSSKVSNSNLKKELFFNAVDFRPRDNAVLDVMVQVIEISKYEDFDKDFRFCETYKLRLVKEDGTWKILKAQDNSYNIENMIKPEKEVDKKGYDDMQSKIDAHFLRTDNKRDELQEYLDRLEFNYNEYMKKAVDNTPRRDKIKSNIANIEVKDISKEDKQEVVQVASDFISKAFSIQVENLEGLDLISKNAKDFEEYVKLRYKLNFGSQYKHESVNLEVEKNEFDFKILEFKSRGKDVVDIKLDVVETTKYKGQEESSIYHEIYTLRLVREDSAWKVLKAQDGSYYIERAVKPEPERDKKGYEDMQSKIDAHFARKDLKKGEMEEYLDNLEFNYNEYMKKRVEELKEMKREENKQKPENAVKTDKKEVIEDEDVIEPPKILCVSFNFDVMRGYLAKFKG